MNEQDYTFESTPGAGQSGVAVRGVRPRNATHQGRILGRLRGFKGIYMTDADHTLARVDSMAGSPLQEPGASGPQADALTPPAASKRLRRVMLLINSLVGGGAERVFSLLADHLGNHLE